jgi:uncharacterized protein YbdZ (MbtH family)
MSLDAAQPDSTKVYQVIANQEDQYTLQPLHDEIPPSWRYAGKTGSKSECLAYIKETWVDMRPLSLRSKPQQPSPGVTSAVVEDETVPSRKRLVDFLCDGKHPVELCLRPERSISLLKEALEQNYVRIRFTDTAGGTDLGIPLDKGKCVFHEADVESARGTIHLEGVLTLDYTRVRCTIELDLQTFSGSGQLSKISALYSDGTAPQAIAAIENS